MASNQQPTNTNNNNASPEDIINQIKENKPQLRHGFDAVALVLHLVMKSQGFRSVGLNEFNTDESNATKFVPDSWNTSPDAFSFSYKHPKSSMTFILKCLMIGDNLLVSAMAVEDKKVHTIEVNVKDYIAQGASFGENYDNLFKELQKLITLFRINIINKIAPAMTKEGYEQGATQQAAQQQQQQQSQPSSLQEHPPRQPPRYDDDPLRIPGTGGRGGGYREYGMPQPYGTPFGVGSHDLYPDVGGFNIPAIPGPGFNPGGGPQGNLIGPNHPGFGPGVNDPYAQSPFNLNIPGRGRGGVPGGPPGARFDPYGPPGVNFPGPNPDEPPPPGMGNMFL